MQNFKLAPEGLELRELDVWGPIYEAKTYGTIITARVVRVRHINGQGETWEIEFDNAPGITGLVPADESGLPDKTSMKTFIGQPISVKVIAVNRKENLVAASRKEAVNIALNKLINQVTEGEEISSVVKSVGERSVLLDIGGGVIVKLPIEKARLSGGVPLDVQYRMGSVVNVIVTGIDKQEKNITVEPTDPWARWQFERGEVVVGTIVGTRDTTTFVAVKPGLIGIAPYRAKDTFAVGDKLEFQVAAFDVKERKLHLVEWDPKKTLQRRRQKLFSRKRRSKQASNSRGEKISTGVYKNSFEQKQPGKEN
ncbi:RNA-binding protein S1 [Desulforamulus profundi]|uniref:RNA-binding protein S1 n=1 Tax=Desulforamulus profundi TaxID=1383067 RepID=A0A2C6MBF9_9FIRM|nr:RNA-binding protein [Desulforamulus profundi]PHJ36844.1 RNA-binding protein S1 [Desulforamulus profundi]